MDLLRVGKVVGQLEGLISKIDTGTLETKKNETNRSIKHNALNLLKELSKELQE